MTPRLYFSIAAIAAIFGFVIGLFGVMCFGRLMMHLRKLEPSIYEQLGGRRAGILGGTPQMQAYLWQRKFAQSSHRPIRAWGARHNAAFLVMLAAFLGSAVVFGIGHLTMRWGGQ